MGNALWTPRPCMGSCDRIRGPDFRADYVMKRDNNE